MVLTHDQAKKICMKHINKLGFNPKCELCDELIFPVEFFEYCKTKRGTELYFHYACLDKLKKKSYNR